MFYIWFIMVVVGLLFLLITILTPAFATWRAGMDLGFAQPIWPEILAGARASAL